jgi:hypothetical protein
MLYRYAPTRQPSPGTLAYAFEMLFSLPSFVTKGPGAYAGGYFNPLQPQQVVYLKSVPNSAVVGGGLVAGQIFGQPLLNNPNQ